MNILALDTCTENCSVALRINNELYAISQPTQRGHSDLILGMMDSLFLQSQTSINDVEAVVFGRGPGSFTGVRVGVAVAQGIAFAKAIPVVPISTLASVAQRAIEQHNAARVAVAIDARMGEVYAAHFQNQNGLAVLLDDEQVCAPDHFSPLDKRTWFAAGTGWREYEAALTQQFTDQLVDMDSELKPDATTMLTLASKKIEKGGLISAEQALPVYLRNDVAKKKGEQ
jgi:tRNA threonylcarbamoyladenosine biosynthesis protein TsaB